MTTAIQFVFPHPYFDMLCNRLTDFDYRKHVQGFGVAAYKPKTAFFFGVVALCCAIAHLEI